MFSLAGLSYPDYEDLRVRSLSFARLAATPLSPFASAAEKGALPEMRFGAMVSGNFFAVLGAEPVWGGDSGSTKIGCRDATQW